MKNIELIMMILILLVVVAGCAYVGWHVWCLVPLGHVGKWSLVGVLALCMVCFFSNFIFGLDDKPMPIAVFLYELGNSALFVGLYMAILFLVLDLARVLHIVPKSFLYDSWAGAVTVLLVIFGLFLYGNLHYHQKTRVPLAMKSEKPMRQVHRIVMLTDLHLGYHNRVDEFQRWVDKVNAEHPEVILIGGDIIDGSIRALEEQGMAAVFHKLQVPVYACLGNHEYYSGELRARKFYQDAGITLLIDRHAAVPLEGGDTLLVIGRDDRTNKSRASVQSLV
ncbi:MAG: metallophosphoesterase, partial [Prevotella sp.]|nr:metallophosphoesterase [Prevotella sp.]